MNMCFCKKIYHPKLDLSYSIPGKPQYPHYAQFHYYCACVRNTGSGHMLSLLKLNTQLPCSKYTFFFFFFLFWSKRWARLLEAPDSSSVWSVMPLAWQLHLETKYPDKILELFVRSRRVVCVKLVRVSI